MMRRTCRRGVEQREAQVRSIASDKAQAAPVGEADFFAHKHEQSVIDPLANFIRITRWRLRTTGSLSVPAKDGQVADEILARVVR